MFVAVTALGLQFSPADDVGNTAPPENISQPAVKRTRPLTRIEDASSSDTPMDFFALATMRGKRGDFQGALLASRVGLVYGLYDTKRVQDPSAPEVLQGMMISLAETLGKDGMMKMQQTDNPESRIKALRLLEKLGKPSYQPDYMVQQTQNPSPSIAQSDSFDQDQTWNGIIEEVRRKENQPSRSEPEDPSPAPRGSNAEVP